MDADSCFDLNITWLQLDSRFVISTTTHSKQLRFIVFSCSQPLVQSLASSTSMTPAGCKTLWLT